MPAPAFEASRLQSNRSNSNSLRRGVLALTDSRRTASASGYRCCEIRTLPNEASVLRVSGCSLPSTRRREARTLISSASAGASFRSTANNSAVVAMLVSVAGPRTLGVDSAVGSVD